jgi:cytoskeletal protein RodZ
VQNFFKKNKEKIKLFLRGKSGTRGAWYFRWHKNRSGLADYQILLFCSVLFISLAFAYGMDIFHMKGAVISSQLFSKTKMAASLSDAVSPADGNTMPADASATQTETAVLPADATASADASSPSADTAGNNTSADTAGSSADIAAPIGNNPSPDTATSSAEITVTQATPDSVQPSAQPTVQQNIAVAQNPAAVTKVTSPILFGNFKSGVIPIMVFYDRPITVSGSPQLILSTGSPATTAASYKYSFGNFLLFQYHIAPGNHSSDLDYSSSSALILDGGQIKDAYGNGASLTLPQPGSPNSLSGYSNIVIDSSR